MTAEEIFLSAVELDDAREREHYLATALSEFPEWATEVRALLRAHEDAGEFLSDPLVEPVPPSLWSAREPDSLPDRIGHYEVVRELGRGGMGVVYLARDPRLERFVAIKLLVSRRHSDPDWLARFRREARAVSALNHPGVLTIHEIGQFDDRHYLATEYVEGETLKQTLRSRRLEPAEIQDFAIQLSGALAAAHAAGIIHRDLKPDNIMVRRDGLLKILDFGLAKQVRTLLNPARKARGGIDSSRFTSEPGVVIGTVQYMSPEQARGQEIDARSDLFSLGIVLYQLVTGEHPFRGETPSDTLAAILERAPRPPREVVANVSPSLERVVLRCLNKDRDGRYATAAELLADLRACTAEIRTPAPPEPAAGRVRPGTENELTAQNDSLVAQTIADSREMTLPPVRYARSGDVNIAWQVVGKGPIDLVFVMGWVSHLEWFWKEPSFAAFLRRLATFSRVILFDKRGTGLSDKVPVNQLPTLEQRMDDLRAVMDAVGSERAVLCGISEGGPMCTLFAATWPERTSALVMIGCYARRLWAPDYPWGPTEEHRQRFLDEIRRDWGGPVGIADRAPSRADDADFREWWASYLRMGASPGAALALTNMNAQIDIRPILPTVQVPTLVVHRSGDQCLRVEEGRYLARHIPGAKFVELAGSDHLPFVGDSNSILDEIEVFLTGVRHAPLVDRVLATVLFAKIEGGRSAPRFADDETSATTIFRAHVRREAELFGARRVSVGADHILLTFDGPARAVRAGVTINESARRLGVDLRTAVHTGPCDVVGDQTAGPAVDESRQIAALAAVGDVLVSGTVKDLVSGSGLEFARAATTPAGQGLFRPLC